MLLEFINYFLFILILTEVPLLRENRLTLKLVDGKTKAWVTEATWARPNGSADLTEGQAPGSCF